MTLNKAINSKKYPPGLTQNLLFSVISLFNFFVGSGGILFKKEQSMKKRIYLILLLILIIPIWATVGVCQTNHSWIDTRQPTFYFITGSILTVYGFLNTSKKVNISKPQVDYSNWSWKCDKAISYWGEAKGIVKNTGNVNLKYMKVYVNYYDGSNNLIKKNYTHIDTCWLDGLSPGSKDSWDEISSLDDKEAKNCKISVGYDYDKIYEKENDPTMIYVGVGLMLIGGWLSYRNRYHSNVEKFQKKSNLDFSLQFQTNGVYCFVSKGIF